MTENDLFGSKKIFSRFFRNLPFHTTDDRKNLKKNFFDRRGPISDFFEKLFFDFIRFFNAFPFKVIPNDLI